MFLREYVYVMLPVAVALDVLQREKNMFLGYLIPTVLGMKTALQNRRQMNGKPLKYCGPLVEILISSAEQPRRFGKYLEDEELQLAAALVPSFKLGWVEDSLKKNRIKTALLEELLKDEPPPEVPADRQEDSREAEELIDDPEEVVEEDQDSEDILFAFRQPRTVPLNSDPSESAEEELERYFRSDTSQPSPTAREYFGIVDGKRNYPRFHTLFLKYNTGLPSSASVERLFSRSGLSLNNLRCRLSDVSLETEIMLSTNKDFWSV